MFKTIIAIALLASAVGTQANPKINPGPPPPNLNKQVSDLCGEMYSASGAEQIDLANEVITLVYAYVGPLSQYDKQCIRDASVIVGG